MFNSGASVTAHKSPNPRVRCMEEAQSEAPLIGWRQMEILKETIFRSLSQGIITEGARTQEANVSFKESGVRSPLGMLFKPE